MDRRGKGSAGFADGVFFVVLLLASGFDRNGAYCVLFSALAVSIAVGYLPLTRVGDLREHHA